YSELRELWAEIAGKRFRVDVRNYPHPLHVGLFGVALALSPDGHYAMISLPVAMAPKGWERYTPYAAYRSIARIKAGPQNLNVDFADIIPHQYVLVNLTDGTAKPLINAPDGMSLGYWSWYTSTASWSSDGQSVVVSPAFLPVTAEMPAEERSQRLSRPCVAVINVNSGRSTCVEQLRGGGEISAHAIPVDGSVVFDRNDDKKIIVNYYAVGRDSQVAGRPGVEIFRETDDGEWVPQTGSPPHFELGIRQTLNKPPVLVVMDRVTDRLKILYDPNPQLESIELQSASVLHWIDTEGRTWAGGLILPRGYVSGKRYPLVVQTHGFTEGEFLS